MRVPRNRAPALLAQLGAPDRGLRHIALKLSLAGRDTT
jgi:hypothetical protein